MSGIRERGNMCRKGQFAILNLVLTVDSLREQDMRKYLKENEKEKAKQIPF